MLIERNYEFMLPRCSLVVLEEESLRGALKKCLQENRSPMTVRKSVRRDFLEENHQTIKFFPFFLFCNYILRDYHTTLGKQIKVNWRPRKNYRCGFVNL